MGWQWHQLDHTQIIFTVLPTGNHASTSSLNFLQAGCSSWRPSNSAKAPKANLMPLPKRPKNTNLWLPFLSVLEVGDKLCQFRLQVEGRRQPAGRWLQRYWINHWTDSTTAHYRQDTFHRQHHLKWKLTDQLTWSLLTELPAQHTAQLSHIP